MFEQSQQSVQGQTSSPNSPVQTPQAPLNTNLQGAVDQQTLENTGSVIELPSRNQQSGVVQSATDTTASSHQLGTGLLIGSFVLAITLIILLARVAVVASSNGQNTPQSNQ